MAEGDEIISGCINMSGVLKIRTTKAFGESTVSKILDLVENASSRKSRSEAFISRFARIYTPAVCIGAVLLGVAVPLLRMAFGASAQWVDWVYRALTFLVVSCPCALVISIPLSFFAGIGGAAARMALCGVLAALAVALMFLGGTVPFASIACPVLASLVLIPVYCECGWKWGLLWYAAVAALAALLAPEKEAAVLFVFFGYYPMLRKLIGRLRVRAAAWAVKLVYVNAAVFAAYGLMLYVFHLTAVMEDFAGMGKAMLAVLLVLANVTFVIYDVLIARLEIYYHVRLRPKLHL